ncbi:MAG: NUDIX domain-containing protein [Eubacterium sp.]|nr:NUDIX domain-containing protein [Eubacterium sp.]
MEIFDLYTAERERTGKTIPRGEPIPAGYYHLAVHVCIFNSEGKMLIQQRQPFKAGWSGMWDVSVGGSAVAGDTSTSAAHRETLEELGADISFENARPVITIHYDEGFDDIYTVHADLDIDKLTLQPEEVKTVKWATADEIIAMIDEGIFIPYHKEIIRLLFFMRNQRGTFTKNE